MADRLAVGRALRRPTARLEPVAHGPPGLAGLGQVVREQLGRRPGQLGEPLLQGAGDAGVEQPSAVAQERAVRRVPHQRVLEQVVGLRPFAAPEDQPGAGELVERRRQLALARARHGGQQLVGELPADHGPDLRRRPGRGAEPVEPRHERGVERGRHCQGGRRARGESSGRPAPAGLEHRLGQLLDEQRHPVRALDDLGHQLVGQRAAGDPPHERRGLPRAEAVERQGRHVRPAGPGRLELRAEGDQQQDPQPSRALDREVEQLARARVDPVHVLEDHQHRVAVRQPLDLAQQRLEGPLPLELRGERRRGVAVAGRERQQLGQQRHVLRGRRGRRQQRLQLPEPRLRRIAAREPGRALELRDDRVQRAVLAVRRAEVAQSGRAAPRRAAPARAASSRDLPTPGSPESRTTRPSPPLACSQRRSSRSSSSSRPTSGARAAAWNASNRLAAAPTPRTR